MAPFEKSKPLNNKQKNSIEANKEAIDKQGLFSYNKIGFDITTKKQILQLRYGNHVLDTKIYGFDALLRTTKLVEEIISRYKKNDYHYYAYGNLDGIHYEKAVKITDNEGTIYHNTAILHENTILSVLGQTGGYEKEADARIASGKFADFLDKIKADLTKYFNGDNSSPIDITPPMLDKLLEETNFSLENTFNKKRFSIRRVDDIQKGYELRFSNVGTGIICSNLNDIATTLHTVTKALKKFDQKKHLFYETSGDSIVIRTNTIFGFDDSAITKKEISTIDMINFVSSGEKAKILVDFLNNGIQK